MNTLQIKIASNIRRIRQIKNLSQEDIYEHIGLSQSSYSKLERGESSIPLDRLDKISKLLGTTLDSIMNFDDSIIIESVSNSQVGSGNYYSSEISIISDLKSIIIEKDKQIASLLKLLDKNRSN